MKAIRMMLAAGALLIPLDAGVIQAEPHTGDLHNCEDFTYREDAEQHLAENPTDPDNLDDDDDGFPCEHLPRRPTSAGGTSSGGGNSGILRVEGASWGLSRFAGDNIDEDAQGSPPSPTTTSVVDHNCADFVTQEAAQAYFDAARDFFDTGTTTLGALDGDGDGVACEDNPSLYGSGPQPFGTPAYNEGPDLGGGSHSLTTANPITPPSTGDAGLLSARP